MPIDFPDSPSNGDTYSAGGKNWVYNGSAWTLQGVVPTIPNGSVGASQLATDAVTNAKIVDGAITSAKIAAGAVGEANIAANAVTQAKLASTLSAVTICTSSTRPGSPFTGQVIYMTDTDETAVYDGTAWEGLNRSMDRNLLINGSFDVWQRGTAVKYNAGQGAYAADRWCGSHQFQGSRTQRTSISSPPSGLNTQFAIRVSSSTTTEIGSGTRMRIVQKVESLNSFKTRGRQVTLSFWARFSEATLSSVANSTQSSYGSWGYAINYYTSTTDSATHTSAGDSTTNTLLTNGSLPTTWTKYTLTGTAPATTNNIEVLFGFSQLGNTASADTNWYEIAQVQLEIGSVATPFEFEDYSMTLAKCQRYYQERNNFWRAQAVAGQYMSSALFTTVPMRAVPTVSVKTQLGRSATYAGALIPTTTVNGARLDNYATAAGVDYYCDDLYKLEIEL